ncbi:uncharacterized protein LOC134773349 [Penaeus indicus]|uniref:uncharacterized protein LOC134773349 n=1 Tax=Penaeus indicus TaxID=29960 RepID=UPI00300BFBE4
MVKIGGKLLRATKTLRHKVTAAEAHTHSLTPAALTGRRSAERMPSVGPSAGVTKTASHYSTAALVLATVGVVTPRVLDTGDDCGCSVSFLPMEWPYGPSYDSEEVNARVVNLYGYL